MADSALLNFTVKSISASLAEIEIKNTSGAVINQPLDIQFTFSSDPESAVISSRLLAAKDSAQISETPRNMASVAGIASVDCGLSVWVLYDQNALILKIVNNFDQTTGAKLPAPVALDAGSLIALKIPLIEKISSSQVNVAYKYKLGEGRGPYITGSLLLKVEDTGKWEPQVSLSVDRENSTMLEPGERVKISWSVKDGVGATLLGPLPGGDSKRTLSNEAGSDFRIDKGSMEVYAVGQATYFLDARVRKPEKKDIEEKKIEEEKIQVVRTLFLDTKQVSQFAHLRVRPNRVLPNGTADVHFAVWGVKKATVRVGKRPLELELTEQDLSGYYQGSGKWSVRVSQNEGVRLEIDNFEPRKGEITVEEWDDIKLESGYTGKPVGLAVAPPVMAVLTSDGLWMATVGEIDPEDPLTLDFEKVTTATPKAWLALTAFGGGFAALSKTNQDRLQLARFDIGGKPNGLPLDLPVTLSNVIKQQGVLYDLVGFGNRIYVVVERPLFRGSVRYAISIHPGTGAITGETLLGRLHGYRLLSFADGLYGLNPDSGQMLRFELPDSRLPERAREIKQAYKAASAAKNGQSLIRTGLPVPVGNLVAVLGPADLPALPSTPLSNLNNVRSFSLPQTPGRKVKEPPRDLVYNPKKDEWTACGRGLTIEPGALAEFRGGRAKRLWLLQPDGQMHTLTQVSPELFVPEYEDGLPRASLRPALNSEKKIEIKNGSKKLHLEPQVENQPRLGLAALNSDALFEVTPRDITIFSGDAEKFDIRYDKDDPSPIRLRFGILERRFDVYFLEVSLSGPGLSRISSVFKRAAVDAAGTPSIVDVTGTFTEHPDNAPIAIPAPEQLEESYKVVVCNGTPHPLLLGDVHPSPLGGYREIEVNYARPEPTIVPFTLTPADASQQQSLGSLRFDFNVALPHGIQVSTGIEDQKSLLRIDCRESKRLAVQNTKTLKPGDPAFEVGYQKDGRHEKLMVAAPGHGVTYVCQIIKKGV